MFSPVVLHYLLSQYLSDSEDFLVSFSSLTPVNGCVIVYHANQWANQTRDALCVKATHKKLCQLKLVQYITNWYNISQTGTRYHTLVQDITNWYNISQTGTIYHKLVQYITNWYYISQTGTNDICPYKMYLQFNIILTSNISSPPRWEFCLSGINKISFGWEFRMSMEINNGYID